MPRKTTYNDCLVLSGVVQQSRVATVQFAYGVRKEAAIAFDQ